MHYGAACEATLAEVVDATCRASEPTGARRSCSRPRQRRGVSFAQDLEHTTGRLARVTPQGGQLLRRERRYVEHERGGLRHRTKRIPIEDAQDMVRSATVRPPCGGRACSARIRPGGTET